MWPKTFSRMANACTIAAALWLVSDCSWNSIAGAADEVLPDEYGTIAGKFLWEEELPELPPLVMAGANVRDPAVCGAIDIPNESLVVNKATGGVANIFIYLKKAPRIHPDLAESKTKEVLFDQKNCCFIPHALFIRTDQTIRAVSADDIVHNVHTMPHRNQANNQLLAPNLRDGLAITEKVPEIMPFRVNCDIHPWMQAYWLVLDHPYADVTGADGVFRLEKLPAGDHTFIVWHERVGYLNRKFTVTVRPGKSTLLKPIKLRAEHFKLDPPPQANKEGKAPNAK